MPAFTVTTTPQLLFKAYFGTVGNPDSFGAQIADGDTGTVYVSDSEASCVVAETNYFNEDSSLFSIDVYAGREVWVVAAGDVDIVYNNFGPTPEDYVPVPD